MSSEIIEGFILSPQQKSLWFDQRDSQQFRARCAVLVEGQLETEVLKDAVRLVVNRHEILRTTFQRRPGMTQPFQVIAAEGEKSWQERDLSELSLADQHARIEQLFSAESAREFDLEHGPLVSFSLLTLNERRHVLLINLPALCADDRTLQNITAEIGDAYASICGGAELEEVSLQYADFAIWQNELLEGEEAAAGLAYWQKQDARACLRQPVPFARVAEKDFAPGDINLRLDLQTSAKIHAAVRRYDTSTEAFLLACWHTLLWRLTGEEEVSVGSRFDGRKYDELARAVGLFSRQLPIRHSFEKRQRFRDVLEQIGRSMREAAEWEEYFIRERHLPERTDDALSTAFFPIGFEFTELPAPVEQAGIRLTLYRQEACADPFALKLRVTGTAEGGLEIALHYDGSRVAREDAERLCGHYHRLLQSVVENASDSLGALRIVDDGERRRILSEFNDTAADFGAAQCIHELFERQAALTPERVAVVFEEEQLTYEELNRRANQVAHYLRESGVGGETLVAILLERSINVVVSFLGVLKAGAAYAPLDPAYPAERLRTMLKEAQVEMVLTEERFVALLPESLPSIHVDRHLPLIQQQPITTPPTQVSGHNLAYVIFTSGSTGAPKGVAIEHRQLFNYLRGVVERIDFPEAARFATVSTFAADLGHTMIFPALCGGGTLHIIAQERATDPQELAAYFRQHRVDCLKIVPSHLQALLTHGRPEEVLPARRLVLGGEASRWDLIEQVGRLAPECRVFNHYGPTETTVGAISGEVETVKGESGERGESVALGRPLGNMAVYILGDGLEPVPVGVAGEVYLGGEGVGRGYLRRPELTAERFIPDPFGAVGGRRMYRTGDVARYLPDGRIEFLGRGDNQVKFHGFRVELNEIRSELNRHPQISDSLITLGKGSGGNEMMVAYYVARQELPVAELREFLSENIIEETIPNAFIHLPKLPLTPNGKINFQALPSVEESRRKVRRTGVAPRTPTEQVLASIWADVLQVGQVSVDDNFFELGGHSLMATQVISRLREAFQRELPLRDLFEAPTVAEMAQRVEAALKGDEQASAPAIERVSRTSPLPLSFAQQRLWFADQLEPGNPAYNILGAVRFKGQLDSNALERSLNEIVKRHETLRTTFTVVEGQPAQVVAESLRIPMPLVDLSALEGTKREAKVLELGAAESRRPFDLATGPLLRVTLLRLAEAEHVLLLGMHHIVSDAWSVGVLARELGAFYAALSEGKQAELPSLPVQYADFAHWQRNWLEGENLESQLAYWKKQLAGAPPVLELPTDYPRPQAQSFRGAKHHHALPYTLTETLKTLSRREGTTLFMTLLAAFQVLLRRYTNQEDIVVGTDIANRNRHEIEGLIGFFVNHPVLRTNLSGNPTFRELLGRVREATLGAYAHQDVPFEKLLGLRKTERSLSHLPLFQVLLVLRNTPSEPLELPGLTLELIEIENETAKFDVALFMEETAAGLVGNWNYSTDLFKPETITLMSEHF
ncbi:MAG TPA: amino acid adenylation domain-containing protein, partial [Pyrinomonadaceae bacterium]